MRFARLAILLLGMFGGALPSAAAEVCDPMAVDLVTTPARTPNFPNVRETLNLQASLPEKTDAILFGDSLFAGWRTDLPKAFPATSVYDFAVGGDRVPNVLWRITNTDIGRLKPKVLALLIGTNDLAAGTPPCAVAVGIEIIVERLRAIWSDTPIFVLTIPPRGRDFREIDDQRLEVNRAIASLGAGHKNVHPVVIDDVAFTCGLYGKSLPTDTANVCLADLRLECPNYVDDHVHFTVQGYTELARILRSASQSTLGKNLFN